MQALAEMSGAGSIAAELGPLSALSYLHLS